MSPASLAMACWSSSGSKKELIRRRATTASHLTKSPGSKTARRLAGERRPPDMARLKVFDKTPASLGYSFPPEWHPHQATWFSWPRPEGISFPDKYHTVPENLARIVREITPHEQVHINVPNANY